MLVALIGAAIVGLSLGLLGSGGSILTVPVLVYLLGHADKPAIAESLTIVGGIALIGALPGLLAGRVDWRAVVLFGGPAVAGTWAGAWASQWVAGVVQLLLFALVMFGAAVMMLRGRRQDAGDTVQSRWDAVFLVAEGIGVGALTGLVGVGGGFLIVPALVLLARVNMHRAIATSLVIIALKSFVGSAQYVMVLDAMDLRMNWTVVWLFVAVGGVAALVGNAWGLRLDKRLLQRIFGAVLFVMAVLIGVREGLRLLQPDSAVTQPPSLSDTAT